MDPRRELSSILRFAVSADVEQNLSQISRIIFRGSKRYQSSGRGQEDQSNFWHAWTLDVVASGEILFANGTYFGRVLKRHWLPDYIKMMPSIWCMEQREFLTWSDSRSRTMTLESCQMLTIGFKNKSGFRINWYPWLYTHKTRGDLGLYILNWRRNKDSFLEE